MGHKIWIGVCLVAPVALVLAQSTAFRNAGMTFEKKDGIMISRIGYGASQDLGQDMPGGRFLAGASERELVLARQTGLMKIDIVGRSADWIGLPAIARGALPTAILRTGRNDWIGLSDGRVLARSRVRGEWREYRTGFGGEIRLANAGGSLLALSAQAAGGIDYFNESRMRFEHYFRLPEDLPVASLTFGLFRNAWYLGTDMGLFSIKRPGSGNMVWEMCGTREGLAKTSVHDMVSVRNDILLATSRVQYPRLPSNVKLTSYGNFLFNYFQGRWERESEFPDRTQEHFVRVNSRNTNLPPGGLWLYNPDKDIAFGIRGAEDDFFRIVPVKNDLWLAAATEGLYLVGWSGRSLRAVRLLDIPRGWIDDLARDAGMVHVLSGRTIYSFALKDWAIGHVSEVITNAESGGRQRQTAGQSAAQKTVVPKSTDFYSEEARFMRQLERYIKK